MCLKGIPAIISPDLLHALASMKQFDEIVLASSGFSGNVSTYQRFVSSIGNIEKAM